MELFNQQGGGVVAGGGVGELLVPPRMTAARAVTTIHGQGLASLVLIIGCMCERERAKTCIVVTALAAVMEGRGSSWVAGSSWGQGSGRLIYGIPSDPQCFPFSCPSGWILPNIFPVCLQLIGITNNLIKKSFLPETAHTIQCVGLNIMQPIHRHYRLKGTD